MEQKSMEYKCPICNNAAYKVLKKLNVQYCQCVNCRTLFCGALDQENLVGGEYEKERNEKENYLRLERVNDMARGIPKEEVRILDFGCGNAMFIDDLKKDGFIHVDGYDAYNEKYQILPKKESYHIVVATEVFEHFSFPYVEIDVIHRSLVQGGGILIETSFVDIAEQEGIELSDFFYVAPQSGHSTIFSHHGLDVMMCLHGFVPMAHYNRHVRCYMKK